MDNEDNELRKYIIGLSIALLVLCGIIYVHTADASLLDAVPVLG